MDATASRCTDLPLVSAVVPVYNAERYLTAALDSILAQDYPNLEIIAVDDGSTDSSLQVLQQYADRIGILTQENAGSARARNKGIEESRGQYIAFLDADDLWHPSKTGLQIREFERHPNVGLVYNEWMVVSGDAEDELRTFVESAAPDGGAHIDEAMSGSMYVELLWDSIVHTSSAMVRADLLRDVGGFNEELRKGQDYDLWLRLSRLTEFRKLAARLSIYRVQDQGVTQRASDVNYGALIVERALDRWGRRGPDGRVRPLWEVRTRLAGLWYSFGWQHLEQANYETARSSFLRSWRYCPWRLGSLRKYMQSITKSGRGEAS